MSYQLDIFKGQYLDPLVLKEGKKCCPVCDRPLKSFGYVLTDKLVHLAFKIADHCQAGKTIYFNPQEILDIKEIKQYHKLGYWKIIEQDSKQSWWKITKIGYRFLNGEIELPRKVWIWRGKVILKDDLLAHISRLEPCYKQLVSDWCLDYILKPYKLNLAL